MVYKKIAISYELKKFNQPALFLSRDPFLKFCSVEMIFSRRKTE